MERTANMPYMVVTLDVSKLSGWLKNGACCRESKGGHTVRASLGELRVGGGKVAGAGGASSALTKGSIADWGHRHGEERTWNMFFTVVTLDVSKLSGWLNTDARTNICCMVVTLDVSKLSGWLKASAS